MRRIYLDHQSATPVAPEVRAAMEPWFAEAFGNPGSLHHRGLEAREGLERAREQVAGFLGAASPEQILFTGSGTEAINLAVKGTAWASRRPRGRIVVSAIEHPAVLGSVAFLEQQGYVSCRVPVDREGFVDPAAVEAALTPDTILVCVHQANHEIGTVEPIRALGGVTAKAGVPFLVDAIASAGWVGVDVGALGATLVALSPHRFGGPKGVGVLYRDRSARLAPLVHGGVQQTGRHAGTENVPAIVGAGVACELAARDLARRVGHVERLQDRLWKAIRATIPGVRLNGPAPGPDRLPNSLSLCVEGVEGEGVLLSLDLQGVAVASGSACLGRSARVSPVLAALGLDPALARGNILLSLGTQNTEEEVDLAVTAMARTVARLRELAP